jgi:hypothetical protein
MAYRGFFIGGNFFGEERAKTKNHLTISKLLTHKPYLPYMIYR